MTLEKLEEATCLRKKVEKCHYMISQLEKNGGSFSSVDLLLVMPDLKDLISKKLSLLEKEFKKL